MSKLSILIVVIAALQVISASAKLIPRSAIGDVGKSLDDDITSLKERIESLISKIQSTGIYQSASSSLKSFADEIQKHGHNLIEKIKTIATDIKSK